MMMKVTVVECNHLSVAYNYLPLLLEMRLCVTLCPVRLFLHYVTLWVII